MADSFFLDARGRIVRRPSAPYIPPTLVGEGTSLKLSVAERKSILALSVDDPLRQALVAADFSAAQASAVAGALHGNSAFLSTLWNRNFGTIGGATHQNRMFLPFGGQWIRIRLIYENPQNVAAYEVLQHGVASGRQYNETAPKNPDGSPVTWQVGGAFNVAAGTAGANDIVETASPWYSLYVVPDAAYPKWGTVIVRSRNTVAGVGRGRAGIGSNGLLNLVNGVAKRYRDTYEYAAAGTAVNSSTFTLTSDPDPGEGVRNTKAFQVEIEPIGPGTLVGFSSDSRGQGTGSTSNLWSWMARTIEQMQIDGAQVGYEFNGLSGSDHATFHAMALDRLNKTGRKLPDIYVLQCGSSNGSTWSSSDVAAAMARNLEFASICRAKGVRPALVTMYPSVSAQTTDGTANWRALNEAVLATGIPCFDFYSRPEFSTGGAIPLLTPSLTLDGSHFIDFGHDLGRDLVGAPTMRQLVGVAA